jgi:phenylacetic acid degradation operon negative regulatory protein
MNRLGVEERTARQAIARAANAGWIEAQRHGREARWALTPQLIKVYEEGEPRVLSLSDPFTEWDGQWLVLFVTVPHELRSVRKRLYSDLEWAGFGNPIAGVWLSPHSERREQVAATIADLGLADSTMSFLGGIDQIGLDEAHVVQSGWDLAGLKRTYAAVARDVAALHPEPGDETLVAHLRMLAALRRFPYSDPQLPEALLPDWVGRRVVSQIVGLREKWNSEVRARWREINAAN